VKISAQLVARIQKTFHNADSAKKVKYCNMTAIHIPYAEEER
jgi:hypothetical protein